MYTLTSIVRRCTALGMAVALFAAAIVPSASVFADALNPLTERSLMLSSSSPGFTNTDGSGNATYAPPGSGPNGQKSGETFSFRVSTDSTGAPLKAITFQYCTSAAGKCQGPGNNTGDARDSLPSARESNATAHPLGRSDLDIVYGTPVAGTDFVIWHDADDDGVLDGGEDLSSGWTMATSNVEDTTHSGDLTGKNNFITLTNATSTLEPETLDRLQISFKASASQYITNPGDDSFFVKLNTYDDDSTFDDTTIVDGGVTVANVMTDSIHITTKVLETMAFSVGTRNRDTLTLNCTPVSVTTGCEAASGATHGTCSPIQNINNNRLNLGDPDAEYSLETGKGWDVNSYWRLSSNSSGGATVYYSGNTLANTVGDEISEVATETISTPGTEQFGLGFIAPDAPSSEFTTQRPGITLSSAPFVTLTGQSGPAFPAGQTASAAYDEAAGTLDNGTGGPGTAKFKFLKSSLTTPEVIAQQDEDVISCSTAKMRYVGNIGADTPAGVYTTKINYLAAPQY